MSRFGMVLSENGKMRRRLETLKNDVDGEMAATIAKMCEMAGLDPFDALSDEDIMQLLKEAFDEFDKDGSGQMQIGEFTQAWNFLGLKGTSQEIQDAFKQVDVDNSGVVSFIEFGHLGILDVLKVTENRRRLMKEEWEANIDAKTVEIIGKLNEAMGNPKRDIGDEEKFYNTLKDTFNA